MCIIVDANRLGKFVNSNDEDAAPIRRWLEKGGKLIYSTGGKFATEVGAKAKQRLAEYARAGRAKLIEAKLFVNDERALRRSDDLRSDGPHVLALARWTGVRLLYTGDNRLMQDFKNRSIINQPRGKVYSDAANVDLLDRSICAR